MYYALKYWQPTGATPYFVPFVAPESFTDPRKYADYGLNVNLYAKLLTYKQTYPNADIAIEFSDAISSVSFTSAQLPNGASIEMFQTVSGVESSVLITTQQTFNFTAGSTNRYAIRRENGGSFDFLIPIGVVWAYCCCITRLQSYAGVTSGYYLKYIFFYENTLKTLNRFSYNPLNGVLRIPSGVTILPIVTFYNCSQITKVIISDNMTAIQGGSASGAFLLCSSITNVEIGSGITEIGADTFNGCTALQEIKITAVTPPTIIKDTFRGIPSKTIWKVPAKSLNDYKTATNWSIYASRIYAI